MSNLKYFLAGVLIMAITSCMQKDSELFLFVGSYADATDPGINSVSLRCGERDGCAGEKPVGHSRPFLSDSEPGWQVCLFGK